MKKPTLLIFCVLFLFIINSNSGITSVTRLPVNYEIPKIKNFAQINKTWCWAASIQMALDYYGVTASQCEIVNRWKNNSCCEREIVQSSNNCEFISKNTTCNTRLPYNANDATNIIDSIFKNYLINRCYPLGISEINNVKSAISSNNPVLIIANGGSGPSHVMLIKGYFKNYWIVNNPLNGKENVDCKTCEFLIPVNKQTGKFTGYYSIQKYFVIKQK